MRWHGVIGHGYSQANAPTSLHFKACVYLLERWKVYWTCIRYSVCKHCGWQTGNDKDRIGNIRIVKWPNGSVTSIGSVLCSVFSVLTFLFLLLLLLDSGILAWPHCIVRFPIDIYIYRPIYLFISHSLPPNMNRTQEKSSKNQTDNEIQTELLITVTYSRQRNLFASIITYVLYLAKLTHAVNIPYTMKHRLIT